MLSASIADQLRRRGHDVEASQGNPGLEGKPDPDLLRAARDLDRVLVTDNVADFARLHTRFLTSGEDHVGIVLVSPGRFPRSKRTIGIWVADLDTFLHEHPEASPKNACIWLQ